MALKESIELGPDFEASIQGDPLEIVYYQNVFPVNLLSPEGEPFETPIIYNPIILRAYE